MAEKRAEWAKETLKNRPAEGCSLVKQSRLEAHYKRTDKLHLPFSSGGHHIEMKQDRNKFHENLEANRSLLGSSFTPTMGSRSLLGGEEVGDQGEPEMRF